LIFDRFLVAVQHEKAALEPCRACSAGANIEAFLSKPLAKEQLVLKRGCDMIEVLPVSVDGSGTQLRLRPPRAMTARQFVMLFAALTGVMWLVAGLGWWTGNVFAPVFALLHSSLVAWALRELWRGGEREEAIRVEAAMVEVFQPPGSPPTFRAHPHWVRLQVEGDERLVLVSSGKQIEIGSFLGPAERSELATTLKGLLVAVDGRNR
jgi:uncharacterized membrane protein